MIFWIALLISLLVSVGALVFLFRHPEISFALFIAAYALKGGINLGFFNLTAILLIVSVLGFFLPVLLGKELKFRIRAADIWLGLFMAILIAGILGYSLNKIFAIFEKRLIHWAGK